MPNGFNRIGASNTIFSNDKYARKHIIENPELLKKICTTNTIHTLSSEDPGWQPALTNQNLLKGCCTPPPYDQYKIEQYSFSYPQ